VEFLRLYRQSWRLLEGPQGSAKAPKCTTATAKPTPDTAITTKPTSDTAVPPPATADHSALIRQGPVPLLLPKSPSPAQPQPRRRKSGGAPGKRRSGARAPRGPGNEESGAPQGRAVSPSVSPPATADHSAPLVNAPVPLTALPPVLPLTALQGAKQDSGRKQGKSLTWGGAAEAGGIRGGGPRGGEDSLPLRALMSPRHPSAGTAQGTIYLAPPPGRIWLVQPPVSIWSGRHRQA